MLQIRRPACYILASLSVCVSSLSAVFASDHSLVGRLETTWIDPVPGAGIAPSRSYTLTDDRGNATQLSIDPELLEELGDYFSWNGKKVKVTLAEPDEEVPEAASGIRVEKVVSLRLEGPSAGRSEKSRSKLATDSPLDSASKPWVILLCKYADRPEVDDDPEYFESLVFDTTFGLDRYWRESSYERMNLNGSVVVDWVTLPFNEDYYRAGLQGNSKDYTKLLDDCTAAADPHVDFSLGGANGFEGIAMVFNGDQTFGGVGSRRLKELDGVYKWWGTIWIETNQANSHAIFAHEMGHGFGLPHSNNGDFDNSPYDNPWDVMSSWSYTQPHPVFGHVGQHTNATFKDHLGWFGPPEKLVVPDVERVSVTIDAMPVAITDHYRAVTVPIYRTTQDYTVEVRKRMGQFDGGLPGDAVIIYKNEPSRFGALNTWAIDTDVPPANFSDNEGTMFRVGETYRDEPNNISITVESETIDGFVVTFDSRLANEGVPCSDANITVVTQGDVDSFQTTQGPCETIEGSLVIGGNQPGESDVHNLLGLADIRSIQRDLRIQNTNTLATLDGLDNLAFANNVHVSNNESLADLSALEALTGTRILQITDNLLLTSLAGLESVETVSEELEITGNQNLGECSALRKLLDWVDDFDFGPGPYHTQRIPDVGGPISIHSNKEGCNSVEEVVPLPSMPSALVGSWYDLERAGTGFMLHGVNENLAVGYYYGFDNEGDRFWLIGVHEGSIEWDQPITFNATYVTGGSFQNFQPGQIEEHEWGFMNLSLLTCEFGVIDLSGQFSGTNPIQGVLTAVTRLAPISGFQCFEAIEPHPTDAITGSWYDPQTAGQGFAIHKIDEATGVIYFYGFDDTGSPLWLIGVWDGVVGFGSELTLQMNQVTGGTFEIVDPDQIVESPWGTLRIRFDGCTTAWAELSGDDGAQVFELDLLAGSAGLECSE